MKVHRIADPTSSYPIQIIEEGSVKQLRSKNYNYNFDKKTGFFVRWGKTTEDDPSFCPVGPEILDIEISVNGCPNACPFCYKNNKNTPATNMSFETFKTILDKMPKTLTQIAFGITGVQTNPDFIKMLAYTRESGVIPNFTLSGIDLTDALADEIVKHIGGLAVSAYQTNKNVCYDTVKKFTDRGIRQTNIHLMTSKETLPFIYELLDDRRHDPRLAKMNAIIFLGVKPKGRAAGHYTPLNSQEFGELMNAYSGIQIGFDSCSAPKYEAAIMSSAFTAEEKKHKLQFSESCESTLFSLYINVHGVAFPCSFSEVGEGVDVVKAKSFAGDVWDSGMLVAFRDKLLATTKDGCRHCPVFPEISA